MKTIKYEMMETMMRFIKKKEDLGKSVSSKRQRNIIERQCYQEFIDILYKWIIEMADDEETIKKNEDKPLTQHLTQHQIEQQQRIAENAGKNPF